MEAGEEEFDPSILITPVGLLVLAYQIPEDDHVCNIGGTKDISLERG